MRGNRRCVDLHRDNSSLGSSRPWSDIAIDVGADRVFDGVEIELRLEIQPERSACAEVACESERRVWRERAFLANDVVDARCIRPQFARERVYGEAERNEELFAEHFAGMDGLEFHGRTSLAIVSGSRRSRRRGHYRLAR